MKKIRHDLRLLGMLLPAVFFAMPCLFAQPTGQWDFENGNLSATVGAGPLQYLDGAGGTTEVGTQFGTTTALGIPDIGGTPAKVMKFPASTNASQGYQMPTPAAPNGGGTLVNVWTIVMDVLFTGSSDHTLRGLLTTDRLADADTDLFVDANNQLGVGNFYGDVSSNAWHRIAMVVNAPADSLTFYIDGVQAGSRNAGGDAALDGRWALTAGGFAELFNDDDGGAAAGYVNSIQLRDVALSKAQMAALGGSQATGIPTTLPPIPSFIEKWMPDNGYARTTDAIGVVLDRGDSTVTAVTLKLDGATTSPVITTNGTQISLILASPGLLPRTDHTMVLSYTDSAAGAKSYTNAFRVPVFFEDFNNLVLGPSFLPDTEGGMGEPNFGTNVWTKAPPVGWNIDDSKMPPQSDPESGRPEWEGWSFADFTWWWSKVDDQDRSKFLKASGGVAIADDDEWDDYGNPKANRGYFNSFLSTPAISLVGLAPNSLSLKFDSSWRPEGFDDAGPDGLQTNNQTATVTVSYDGGAAVEVLHYDSQSGGPFFKDYAVNETVFIQLNNPAGATSAVVTFGLTLAANDWWWAFDNLVLDSGGVLAPSFIRQPQSQLVYSGADLSLSVAAVGSDPLSYQWTLDGTNIAGATGTNYTKANFQAANAGDYAAIVSNAGGAITSSVARVEVFSGSITQDMVVHLKLDNSVTDSSGRNNNGTPVGAPSYVVGKVGANALHIPSGSDYVTLGTPADLNFGTSTDFTIAFWEKLTDWSGDPSFIGNKDWNGGGNTGYVIATDDNAHLQWNLAGPPGARKDYDGPGGTLTNGWHHIVMAFDRSGSVATYLDGVQVDATDIGANQNNLDTPAGFATNIGQDGTGSYGSGFTDLDLDDLGIWRRLLTAQEIASVYANGQLGQDLSTATGAKAPAITAQPQSYTVSPGTTVLLSVGATGSEPLTYQWKLGAAVVGTGSTLNLANVQTANAGDYTVVLANAAGSATSAVARVDVFAGAVSQDLVVHLKFDNNLTDSSTRGNNGTAVGVPTFATGKVGANAVHIPSGTDYVTLGTPADLQFGVNTDLSVAFWAKVVAWSGDPAFIGNKDWDSGNNPGWVLATDSDGRLQWNTAGTVAGASGDRKDYDGPGGTFTNGNWHHVVLTYDRTGNAVTYVDGAVLAHRDGRLAIPVATPANNLDTPAGKATNIGQDGTGAYPSPFTNLDLDDLGIWRRIITPQEVSAIYSAGQAGNDLSTAVVGGGTPGPTITSVTVTGNNINITVTGAGPGSVLQFKPNLNTGSTWQDVGPITGSTSVPISGAQGFYRVSSPP